MEVVKVGGTFVQPLDVYVRALEQHNLEMANDHKTQKTKIGEQKKQIDSQLLTLAAHQTTIAEHETTIENLRAHLKILEKEAPAAAVPIIDQTLQKKITQKDAKIESLGKKIEEMELHAKCLQSQSQEMKNLVNESNKNMVGMEDLLPHDLPHDPHYEDGTNLRETATMQQQINFCMDMATTLAARLHNCEYQNIALMQHHLMHDTNSEWGSAERDQEDNKITDEDDPAKLVKCDVTGRDITWASNELRIDVRKMLEWLTYLCDQGMIPVGCHDFNCITQLKWKLDHPKYDKKYEDDVEMLVA